MGNWLFKMERKYGHRAIQNLSLVLIVCYALGYIIQYVFPEVLSYLVLNPYLILHGQVWRLVSWILIPPGGFDIFTIIMLYFYFSIGRSLEYTWGAFRYNVYIFSGIIFTIIGAFVLYGIAWIEYADLISSGKQTAEQVFTYTAMVNGSGQVTSYLPGYWFYNVSTYYVSMSIFLAYAITFPEMRVLLMFIIPIRVKVLGIIYAAFLAFSVVGHILEGRYYMAVIIVASLLNALVFFLATKNFRLSASEVRRKADYRRKVTWAKNNTGHETVHEGKTVITRHKCAICGKTELDGDIEFRFCSKCDGNYEYCSEHLYTHEHVKRI